MDGIGRSFLPFKRTYLTCFYSVLARSGYFPVSELATFLNQFKMQGHPTTDGLPGIRIASGSLGQGMSVGIELLKLKKTMMII
jgi:transketolase